jgi:hypothetical protein
MTDAEMNGLPRERAILVYWRLPRPNGQVLACTSYRTDIGLLLRCALEGEPAVLQAIVATHSEAQWLAGMWRERITEAAAA